MADPAPGRNGTAATPDGVPPPSPGLSSGPGPRPTPDPAHPSGSTPNPSEPKPVPPSFPSGSTPSSSSTSRYIPQFSAATQMILKRIKSESTPSPSTFNTKSTSPQPRIKSEIMADVSLEERQAIYENARRVVEGGMKTWRSTTLAMPSPAPRPAPQPAVAPTLSMPSSTISRPPPVATHPPVRVDARPKIATGAKGMSAIRRITMGLTASGRPIAPPKPTSASEPKEKKAKPPPAARAPKRKPGRPAKARDDDDSSLSELSDLSDAEHPAIDKASTPTTTTKSGRQVQKPSTYNPAAMDSNGKKRVYSKVRTTEQALCKLCTRMASPDWNQIVFCDGCNDGWHQRCHDPMITNDVVNDTNKAWYCSTCQSKRDHQTASKKPRVAPVTVPTKVSWASAPPQQKRAYLSTLPQQDLVALIMGVLDDHPDLPIFPGEAAAPAQKEAKQPDGVTVPVPDQDNEEEDELTRAWPKPGQGLFNAQLAQYMADNPNPEDDYKSVSHIVYRDGKKVWENGVDVV